MTKFIELHVEGNPITLNTSHIFQVYADGMDTIVDCGDITYCVEECYEEIKSMLLPPQED